MYHQANDGLRPEADTSQKVLYPTEMVHLDLVCSTAGRNQFWTNPVTIIEFPLPDPHYDGELVEDIRLPDIPFTWRSNLSESQLREVYNLLLRERFFVREPGGLKPDSDMGIGSISVTYTLAGDYRETTIEYEGGYCLVILLQDHITAVYKTARQYADWCRDLEKRERADEYHRAQVEALENKEIALLDRAYELEQNVELNAAEQVLLEWRELRLSNPTVFRIGRTLPRMIQLYGKYDSPSKGLIFLDSLTIRKDAIQGYYLYCQLAREFFQYPDKCEQVFRAGLRRFPNEGQLYKGAALYFARDELHRPRPKVGLLENAIQYCREAIEKGLSDDTKSGFPGRLKRLKKRLALAEGE